MVKYAFMGFGITFVCLFTIVIPIVHFVSVPLAPLIGGWFAGNSAKAKPGCGDRHRRPHGNIDARSGYPRGGHCCDCCGRGRLGAEGLGHWDPAADCIPWLDWRYDRWRHVPLLTPWASGSRAMAAALWLMTRRGFRTNTLGPSGVAGRSLGRFSPGNTRLALLIQPTG